MKVSDLTEEQVVVGLRIRGLQTGKLGTVVKIDFERDRAAWCQWDGDDQAVSAFYGNDCECEVVREE